MKKSLQIIFIGIFLSIIFIFLYSLYPKKGSFDDLVLKSIEKEYITRVIVADEDKQIRIDETEMIGEVISKLSELNIREYKKDVSHELKNSYVILLKNKETHNDYLGIYLYDTGYVEVFILDKPNNSKNRIYKIIAGLDIEYVKGLLS